MSVPVTLDIGGIKLAVECLPLLLETLEGATVRTLDGRILVVYRSGDSLTFRTLEPE